MTQARTIIVWVVVRRGREKESLKGARFKKLKKTPVPTTRERRKNMANIPPTEGTLEELCQVLMELGHENVCADGWITEKLLEQPDTEALHEAVQNLYVGYAEVQEQFGKPPHSCEHLDYLFLYGSLSKRDLHQESMRPSNGAQPHQIPLTQEDKEVLAQMHQLQKKYLAERLKVLNRTRQTVLRLQPPQS